MIDDARPPCPAPRRNDERSAAWRARRRSIAAIVGLAAASLAAQAGPALDNPTGLPAYPRLQRAAIDPRWRTENLGRWCERFTGETSDSLATVASWYRHILREASETDLSRDGDFSANSARSGDRSRTGGPVFGALARREGIKLSIGTDYIALYAMSDRQATAIELHHCGSGR